MKKNFFYFTNKFKDTTIRNYICSFYILRLVAVIFIFTKFFAYLRYASSDIYKPHGFYLNLLGETYPSLFEFSILCISSLIFIMLSLIKPTWYFNIGIFITLGIINLFTNCFLKINHSSHLLLLAFFLGLFINPNNLSIKKFKHILWLYFGILFPYSLSAFWKIGSMTKTKLLKTGEDTWFSHNAERNNIFIQWRNHDELPPEWFTKILESDIIWQFVFGISLFLILLSVLGTINRKFLTFIAIFLTFFHLHNLYFIKADFTFAILTLLALFFPYHLLTKTT